MNLKGRSFLKLLDFTSDEIDYLINFAKELKQKKKNGEIHRLCEGKNIALIFEKESTRTRCAFEVAANDLGAHAVYINSMNSQIGKKESIIDTAKVLGRMFDGIEYRGYNQKDVENLSKYSGVPVWNGLTNESHPTQVLADLLTMREHLGTLKGKKLVYMGNTCYNMSNSLMVGCLKMGINFSICAPKKYFPDEQLIDICKSISKSTNTNLIFEEDPIIATKDADIIYTDVWLSMGEPYEIWEERINYLLPYRVTKELMDNAGKQCKFMHCLPAFHNLETTIGKEIYEKFNISSMEVTDDVFKSHQSIVFDQAENRLHTIKAVIASSL